MTFNIMKTTIIKIKLMLLLGVITLMSCELEEDKAQPDPTYDVPVITALNSTSLDGSTLELFVGQSIIYSNISITGSVGITNFKVLIDGEEVQSQEYDGTSGQVESSFELQVPGDWIDTSRQLTFVAEDLLGQVTEANITVIVGTVTPQYNIENIELNGQEFRRITGTININETLDDSALWIIKDSVQVAQQIKLTITEGAQIFAETPTTILLVNQLGEVDWQGTASNPIVFNSLANAPGQPGDDTPGQWEGIRINGDGTGSNSGIIRYVRQMYAGFGSDGENALRLDDVGSSTTIEFVQIYKNDQRAIRLNGGDVGLKYIISTNGAGTGFRMDDDWNGTGQFWIVNKDIEAGNAIEGREGNPVLSNITITGVGFNSPGEVPDGGGFRIRDGGNARIYNAVVTGVDRSLRYSGGSEQGVANGISFFRDSASFNNDEDGGSGFHSSAAFFNPTSPDYEPVFNNSVEPFTITDSYIGISTVNSTSAGTLGSFFTDVNYIGAVEPGNDWTLGWCLNLDGTLRQ
jgi:hypothetical protein